MYMCIYIYIVEIFVMHVLEIIRGTDLTWAILASWVYIRDPCFFQTSHLL